MADTFQKIFTSELFTFFVGRNKRPIVVHSGAVTKHSKVLNTLINGGMAEAQTRSATLDDIEEDDFIRFLQFAYMGDYSTPPFTIEETTGLDFKFSPQSETFSFSPQSRISDFGVTDDAAAVPPAGSPQSPRSSLTPRSPRSPRSSRSPRSFRSPSFAGSIQSVEVKPPRTESEKGLEGMKIKQLSKTRLILDSWGIDVSKFRFLELSEAFENKRFYTELPRQPLLDSCEPVSNSNPKQDFAPVLLAHARLYVFADKYGIKPLQDLVLQKLQQTLVRFELYPERIKDILELVRYTYSDDHTLDNGADELRVLVAIYMASRIDKLKKSDYFLTLMEDGGAFARDFWLIMRNNICI